MVETFLCQNISTHIWDKVFKNEPSEICGRQLSSNFLKAVFHKFHLVHSWILCPIYWKTCLNLLLFGKTGKFVTVSWALSYMIRNPFNYVSWIKKEQAEAVVQRCSVKKGVLRNLVKFTGKHLCQNLFSSKVTGLRPATLLKKGLWHGCFPVNFAKFLRTLFFIEHLLWWLLLNRQNKLSRLVQNNLENA